MSTPYGQDPRSGAYNPNPGWGPGAGPPPAPHMTGQQPAVGFPPSDPSGFPAQEPPRKSGSGALIALSGVVVLALAAAGVFLFLWLGAKGDASDLAGRLDARGAEISQAQDAATKAEDAAKKAEEAAKTAETEKASAQRSLASATKCREAARAFIAAARGTNQDEINRTADGMLAAC
ncbi:hypothetical protein [Actinokineospora pegani]|uniref:hypothetical protein n=1 Tax=Actinokineospora pegani TaxID=2654637 RepID=UPI0012EAE6C6|nr:hypothetical protein [Actinokineospora pegani]